MFYHSLHSPGMGLCGCYVTFFFFPQSKLFLVYIFLLSGIHFGQGKKADFYFSRTHRFSFSLSAFSLQSWNTVWSSIVLEARQALFSILPSLSSVQKSWVLRHKTENWLALGWFHFAVSSLPCGRKHGTLATDGHWETGSKEKKGLQFVCKISCCIDCITYLEGNIKYALANYLSWELCIQGLMYLNLWSMSFTYSYRLLEVSVSRNFISKNHYISVNYI